MRNLSNPTLADTTAHFSFYTVNLRIIDVHITIVARSCRACKSFRRNQIGYFIIKVSHLAEPSTLVRFYGEVEALRLFRIQVGIAVNINRHRSHGTVHAHV